MGIEKYIINEESTILKALRHMDDNKIKYLLSTNDNKQITGTLTDGDIRRSLLHNYSLNDKIKNIANKKFIYITDKDGCERIIDIFHQCKVDFIPILNENFELKNIITRHILNVMLLIDDKIELNFDFDCLNDIVIEHEIKTRPWGYYKTMILNKTYQSKIIYVLPNQSISLQSHNLRDEYWMIVAGKGAVELNDSTYSANPGCTYFIPRKCKHRLINKSSKETLILNEVQLGSYFGEDDIIRYKDKYGRE